MTYIRNPILPLMNEMCQGIRLAISGSNIAVTRHGSGSLEARDYHSCKEKRRRDEDSNEDWSGEEKEMLGQKPFQNFVQNFFGQLSYSLLRLYALLRSSYLVTPTLYSGIICRKSKAFLSMS